MDDKRESWLNRTWRPMAAVVYLAICVFDFIIAPSWSGIHSMNAAQLAQAVRGLDPSIATILVQPHPAWSPMTLQNSGLFHVAFGAILGVAAWTRGVAQIEQVKQDGENTRSPYTPTMVPTYYLPTGASAINPPAPGGVAPVTQVNVNTTPDDTSDCSEPSDK